MANEAVKFVWEGAIPLQIHLHKSDVASHPAPPPALVILLSLLFFFYPIAGANLCCFVLDHDRIRVLFCFRLESSDFESPILLRVLEKTSKNLADGIEHKYLNWQVLAPRIGYLPLLVHLIKPYFKDSLPPGEDSIWFDYKGFPLKWYIPTGVLFDLLCAEPERPWNLTGDSISSDPLCHSLILVGRYYEYTFRIHFRGYPSNILIPCEGEDSVKWNFVNSLKEAAYIINGNCKNVMNMSQSDQEDLWTSVMNGDLDAYTRLSPKLKMGTIEDDYSRKTSLSSPQSLQGVPETDVSGQVKTARIPVRLYVRSISKDFENLEEVAEIDTWDDISYLNRPVEFLREEGKCFTLRDAIESLLPEFIGEKAQTSGEERSMDESEEGSREMGEIRLVRIQGIETKLEIPFSWVVNNLVHPEFYLHISVLVKAPQR